MQKKQLRQHYRCMRRSLSSAMQQQASFSLAKKLSEHELFLDNHKFACYLAFDGEININPLIEKIWQQGKQCYLPKIISDQEMQFVLYEKNSKMQKNQFNILEPQKTAAIDVKELDVVLMPLVAFDKNGFRLGMGAGYYDRALAFLQNAKHNQPLLIGVAYDCQQCDKLPIDEWDVPFDHIFTESGLKPIKKCQTTT